MSAPLTLTDWLAHLERQHPISIDLGLERVAEVACRMGILKAPIARRVITVAGTNGKGSTVAMLEALGQAHGMSTATYTSPHLLRYNERLRFDGNDAEDELLIAGFERVEAARLEADPVSLTYFEAGTLAALWAIADQQPELAILEVGLGGRLDAVNVIDPDVAVVTTVALDHAAFLGTDLEQIGREKAGIMRTMRPAILGSERMPASVRQVALALGAGVHALGSDFWHTSDAAAADSRWSWHGRDGHGNPLVLERLPDPRLPKDNAASALQAMTMANVTLEVEACRSAFSSVHLPGRMQWVGQWCLDVAHNPHAAEYLALRLGERPRPARRIALLGMLGDKDAEGVISALSPQIDGWVTVSLEGERARASSELAALVQAKGQPVLFQADSPVAGAEWLFEALAEGDEALVCGSFYTVADVLGWFRTQEKSHPSELASSVRRKA